MSLLEIPQAYRSISPYVKIAVQFTETDQVLYYWLLNYSVEKALNIGHSDPASKQYLITLLDVLEKIKTQHPGDESYAVGAVAQCHVEAKALRLFTSADEQDRQGIFNKNVVKLFYTSGLLFDILSMFSKEELEEKLQEARKYAKWKATEINNCLKNGTTPHPGPPSNDATQDDELTRELLNLDVNKPQPTPRTTSNPAVPNQFNQPGNFPPPEPQHNRFDGPPQQYGDWPPQSQQFNANYPGPQQHFGQAVYPPQQQHTYPSSQHHHNIPAQPGQNSETTLDDFIEARKFTKMATSALDYEDAKTAIDFLRKALKVLEK